MGMLIGPGTLKAPKQTENIPAQTTMAGTYGWLDHIPDRPPS